MCYMLGLVPTHAKYTGKAGLEAMDIGNGDLAPEWGVDLAIHGGLVNYGPWADRQRSALSRFHSFCVKSHLEFSDLPNI